MRLDSIYINFTDSQFPIPYFFKSWFTNTQVVSSTGRALSVIADTYAIIWEQFQEENDSSQADLDPNPLCLPELCSYCTSWQYAALPAERPGLGA